jgi:hypothetical protein
LISHLNPNNVFRFERNINNLNRVEYLSNRDAVEKKMYILADGSQPEEINVGRLIVPIQGAKADVHHKEERALPLIKVYIIYFQCSLFLTNSISYRVQIPVQITLLNRSWVWMWWQSTI